MADSTAKNETLVLLTRLRAVLSHSGLDCECQETLNNALDRFSTLEQRRLSRLRLSEARDSKERIMAILGFLSDLDWLTDKETDATVFEELALLFDEVGVSAAKGAAALRAFAASSED